MPNILTLTAALRRLAAGLIGTHPAYITQVEPAEEVRDDDDALIQVNIRITFTKGALAISNVYPVQPAEAIAAGILPEPEPEPAPQKKRPRRKRRTPVKKESSDS